MNMNMNTVQLRRQDYAQLGYTTSKNCLKLIPPRLNPARNVLQKIVIGDHNGVLTCMSRSKNAFSIIFKTLPGTKIESVKLGGALGTVQDKIFVACGSMVKGYSKKGKQFFAFETNSTEPICNMYVYGVDVFLCGSYSMTHYRDCHEVNYFLCGDRINDLICLPVLEGGWVGRALTPVLAGDDRTLKVLKGSDLEYSLELGGTPNILHLYRNTGGLQGDLLLYGTKDGRLGLAHLPVESPVVKWEISSTTSAAVTAIDCYSFSGNANILDVIIGKQDGNIEIYSFEDEDQKPKILQQFQNNEGITSLCCGKVTSLYYDEIVACSYSGWIFSLTTEPSGKQAGSNEETQEKAVVKKENDQSSNAVIEKLRKDIEELQARVNMERDAYQKNTQKQNSLSAIPLFPINDNFTLNKDDASYTLTIELQSPIDYVVLQSAIPLDLLDVEKNAAVVSMTPCPQGSSNALLATFRCQANTTRMEMKVRSVEGQYGALRAYVSPKLHPAMCQVREYAVKPLSLHQRAHKFDNERPNNSLSLTGPFTMAECHSWITFCLPDVPERCPDVAKNQYWFISTFLGTQLECSYGKGNAVFRSDNVSTIAILRDALGKETSKRKLKLDVSCDVNDESVVYVLKLIQPKLEYLVNLSKKANLAQALKDLQSKDNESSFDTGEFEELMRNYEDLQSEYKRQQANAERIYGVITDLLIDKFKFKGQNAKNKVPELLQYLDQYDFANIVRVFQD